MLPFYAEGNRFGVANPQTVIYSSNANGFYGAGNGPPPQVITADSVIDGQAFVVAQDHSLWEEVDDGWFMVSPAGTILSVSTSATAADHLTGFAVAADHSLWEFQDSWTMLSPAGTVLSTAAVADVSGNDVVFAITADHNLWEHTRRPRRQWLADPLHRQLPVRHACVPEWTIVFGVLTDNSLWEYSPPYASAAHLEDALAGGHHPVDQRRHRHPGHRGMRTRCTPSRRHHQLWYHTSVQGWSIQSSNLFEQISATTYPVDDAALVVGRLSDGSLWSQYPGTMLSPAGTIASLLNGQQAGVNDFTDRIRSSSWRRTDRSGSTTPPAGRQCSPGSHSVAAVVDAAAGRCCLRGRSPTTEPRRSCAEWMRPARPFDTAAVGRPAETRHYLRTSWPTAPP